jgi:transcriptional regulator with XRE-family HTH domain
MVVSPKEQLLKAIGERIQSIRKRLDLKQKEFAEELGISGPSLSEVEAGNARPTIEIYYHLTGKFNVSQDYLFMGNGSMFLEEKDIESPVSGAGEEAGHFLETFLLYFKKSKLVRTAMMGHFSTFLLENEPLIEKDLKKNKSIHF